MVHKIYKEINCIMPIMADVVEKPPNNNNIKHLCLSGGGIYGLAIYGALKEAHKLGVWKLEDIESIYACSAGTIITVLVALNFDWEEIDNYLINRPWKKIFDKEINASNIMSILLNKGVYDRTLFIECFKPFFAVKEISLDITMQEFYDLCGIHVHFFTTNLNTFSLVDVSYKTHPDEKLIDAVYYSCSIPVVFSPTLNTKNECLIDPIFHMNYPLEQCLKTVEDKHTILGIRKRLCKYVETGTITSNPVTQATSFVEYITKIITILIGQQRARVYPEIQHQITIDVPNSSTFKDIYDSFVGVNSKEFREDLITLGIDTCRKIYDVVPDPSVPPI